MEGQHFDVIKVDDMIQNSGTAGPGITGTNSTGNAIAGQITALATATDPAAQLSWKDYGQTATVKVTETIPSHYFSYIVGSTSFFSYDGPPFYAQLKSPIILVESEPKIFTDEPLVFDESFERQI
jgi:hypothetical protein